MNYYDYLKILPDSIPHQTLKYFYDMREGVRVEATTTSNFESFNVNRIYRNTDWIKLSTDDVNNLYGAFKLLYEKEVQPHYSVRVVGGEPPQYLYYGIGGKYDVHNDSESYLEGELTRVAPRDISMIAYINDDYEGGELEFDKLQITIKPKRGMVICFPSYDDFSHVVHPVTKGTRLSLVSWFETDERIYSRPY